MRLSIATFNSWAIDHAERVSVALRKQELLRQLRDADATPPRPRPSLWRGLLRIGGADDAW